MCHWLYCRLASPDIYQCLIFPLAAYIEREIQANGDHAQGSLDFYLKCLHGPQNHGIHFILFSSQQQHCEIQNALVSPNKKELMH